MTDTFDILNLLLPLIVIVDIMAIAQLWKSGYFSTLGKTVIILLIILVPILGVSISYFLLFREQLRKGRV